MFIHRKTVEKDSNSHLTPIYPSLYHVSTDSHADSHTEQATLAFDASASQLSYSPGVPASVLEVNPSAILSKAQ